MSVERWSGSTGREEPARGGADEEIAAQHHRCDRRPHRVRDGESTERRDPPQHDEDVENRATGADDEPECGARIPGLRVQGFLSRQRGWGSAVSPLS